MYTFTLMLLQWNKIFIFGASTVRRVWAEEQKNYFTSKSDEEEKLSI